MKENYELQVDPNNPSGGIAMSLDESAAVPIMKAIIKLYAKPGEAILREISSNAWDSHQVAGQTRPVEVSLPSYDRSVLIIEDYGVGLNWSEIPNAFSKIGFSTKRQDNRQRGAFGFGAKSPILIADAFKVIGTKDGVRTVTECRKTAEGIGEFFLLSETRVDAPNGVRLEIPVPHYNQFDRNDILTNFFIGWEYHSVTIDGHYPIRCLADAEQFTELKVAGETVGWVSKEQASNTGNRIYASFGGVIYPVKQSDYYDNYHADFTKLRNYGRLIYLNLPLASVETTPSREELLYSPVTKATLKTALADIARAIELETQQTLELASGKREAIRAYVDALNDKLWVSDALTYRGEKVPSEFVLNGAAYSITKRGRKRTDSTYTHVVEVTGRGLDVRTMVMRNSYTVKIDDAADMAALKRKFNYFLEGLGEKKNVEVIFHTDDITGSWFEAAATQVLTIAGYNTVVAKGRKTYEADKPEKQDATYMVATGMDGSTLRVRRLTAARILEEAGERPILHLANDEGRLGKIINKNLRQYHAVRLGGYGPGVMRVLTKDSYLILTENITARKKLAAEIPGAMPAQTVLRERANLELARVQQARQQDSLTTRLMDYSNTNWSRNHAWRAFTQKLISADRLNEVQNPELRALLPQLVEPTVKTKPDVLPNTDLLNWFNLDANARVNQDDDLSRVEAKLGAYLLFPTGSSSWTDERVEHTLAYVNAINPPEPVLAAQS